MSATAPPAARQGKRERQKIARREAILAAARQVFARKSYDGSTMADIARAAGVAAGTVYLYYASKSDLFAALNARLLQVINEAIQETPGQGELREGIRARIRAIFAACRRHRDLLRLVFLNPDPRTQAADRLRNAEEERLRIVTELIRGGMAAGTVRQADPVLLARIANGLVIVALYQCFVQSDGRDSQAYEDTVTEMIVGGLTPTKTS